MAQVISIHSYRGGTGKSNLTANLAALLALAGRRVAVVDTDLQSPGIHALFGLDNAHRGRTLNDYLWGHAPLEEAARDVSGLLDGAGGGRLFLIPASAEANDIARILQQGYDVGRLNDGFRSVIKTLEFDYLFLDTHPGLSQQTFLSIAISNLLLVILRPDRQDFQGTAVTVEVARHLKVPKMLLVVNKVLTRMDFASLKARVEETYALSVAGLFPLCEDLMQLASDGIFVLHHPEHPYTRELRAVARQIGG